MRWDSGLLVTPSGIPYDEMTADDIVFMDMDGGYKHHLVASSEWRMHRDILRARGEVNAIVHAHSVYATAFAICGMEIPAVHYMIAVAGGPTIRCAPYETYGTEELSKVVLEALSGRDLRAHRQSWDDRHWPAISARRCGLPSSWKPSASNMLSPFKSERRACWTPREVEKTIEKFKDYGLRRKPRAA